VATIATLEIAPAHTSDGWLLTVTVEDEIGPRASGEGTTTEAEQQIDLRHLLQHVHSARARGRECSRRG